MKIQLRFFGQLAEIAGVSHLEVMDIYDTHSLIKKMGEDYPKLNTCKFLVSVEKKIIKENIELESGNEVAFLPPFSGG